MTEQDQIAGLAEQIELARKSVEEWPQWLRPYAYPADASRPTGEAGDSKASDAPANTSAA